MYTENNINNDNNRLNNNIYDESINYFIDLEEDTNDITKIKST